MLIKRVALLVFEYGTKHYLHVENSIRKLVLPTILVKYRGEAAAKEPMRLFTKNTGLC